MQILGIESAAMTASVALVKEGITVAEYTVDFKKTHSQTLLPMIDEIIRMTQIDTAAIDAIAVSAGPGSFTGLRIGSATAKGLGLAWKKPLISVPTLAAMAYQCFGTRDLVCPIMDARRGQVYTGLYTFDEMGTLITCVSEQVIMMEEWIEQIKDQGKRVIFLGDAVPVFREMILASGITCVFTPAHMSRQRAAAVAALGEYLYIQGNYESAAEHAPCYLRKSQAEREREEKLASTIG